MLEDAKNILTLREGSAKTCIRNEKPLSKPLISSMHKGLTCDIIDESFYKPIIVAPTNPSCSTST
jgi:hypothetical protein